MCQKPTTRQFDLTLAGLTLSVYCDVPLAPIGSDPAYEGFIGASESRDRSVRVDLSVGDVPDLSRSKCVFTTDQSWSLHEEKSVRHVAFRRISETHPYCVASLNASGEMISIVCDESMVSGGVLANPLHYPLDQVLLLQLLPQTGGVLVHATGIRIGDAGYVLPGRSGAGKTTIARSLAKTETVDVLSDDRVIVRQSNEDFTICGTPWPGEGGFAINDQVSLSGVVFLEHGQGNELQPLSPEDAFSRLMPVASVPWYDVEAMTGVIQRCRAMVDAVPSFRFAFEPGAEAAEVIAQLA